MATIIQGMLSTPALKVCPLSYSAFSTFRHINNVIQKLTKQGVLDTLTCNITLINTNTMYMVYVAMVTPNTMDPKCTTPTSFTYSLIIPFTNFNIHFNYKV